jgi:hypothetical protein
MDCDLCKCIKSPEPTSTSDPTPTQTNTSDLTPTPTSTSDPTPTPTNTSTPSPTPTNTSTQSSIVYGTTITVPSGSNKINGSGVTLVSTVGSSLSYDSLVDFGGTAVNILLYVAGVQAALITITNPYLGQRFRFTKNTGENYEGTFEIDERVDFQGHPVELYGVKF